MTRRYRIHVANNYRLIVFWATVLEAASKQDAFDQLDSTSEAFHTAHTTYQNVRVNEA